MSAAPLLNVGSDFLHLDIGQAPAGGRAAWLADRLRLAIADGAVPVGSRLPATRVLAADLGVSRGVVVEAYQRLMEDGHVAGRGRGGTVVVALPVAAATTVVPADVVTAPDPAGLFASVPGPDIFDAVRTIGARIDLTPGVPDLAAFPRTDWLRAERAVLGRLAASDLGYGDPRGTPTLRRAVAGWLARNRGISVDPAEVIITTGVSQALGLLAQALLEEGVTALGVEEPGSLGVRQHLDNWRLDTVPIPVDAAGVRVDELTASEVSVVMLTPAHQFPTGVVLDGERRRQLADWARAGGLVIEDDYDAEHRYDRPPVPALRATMSEQVCYTGSVSKLLAPGLRIGWLLVPHRYREAVVAAKRNADLGNAVLPQLVLAELITSGALERQLRQLRRRHVRRRDAMTAALARHLPGATVHGAAAGLHLTVTLDDDVSDTELAAAALARGVKVQPLSWHCQRPHQPGLVLGYAANSASAMDEGIALVAAAATALRRNQE
ncbi:GntR family transcriptional regulator / MocR family aminotransferase [Micromonospora phaseoli]|uniref:GntR family transcriptional regulator / MocR family aminotransferase n=1 Tax=Micromonospora phaseoli TaxID=1144548 RepID=A0A1H7DXD8_9ACTN|nr:GntR family transcriptional regulator/MocR family aminotransferase [Micromonospora phaseoli]SEK06421.1 GntR family transcriptional regulator / MocR family aminotransferase [Micromonospora phaseoli]